MMGAAAFSSVHALNGEATMLMRKKPIQVPCAKQVHGTNTSWASCQVGIGEVWLPRDVFGSLCYSPGELDGRERNRAMHTIYSMNVHTTHGL